MSGLVAVGCVGIFFISLMFKSSVMWWGRLLIFILGVLKWVFIIGFVASFVNLPQMYSYTGWTPVSALFGPDMYNSSLKTLNLPDPRKRCRQSI